MASLPTSLHFFFREGCSRCDRSHIPAPKMKKSLGRDSPPPPNPYPPENSKIRRKDPEASADGVHHRNLPGFFSTELGSGIGHSSQVNHQMMAASQPGSRGEVKGGVGSCGRFRKVRSGLRDAPLPCLMQPCSDVRAPQLSHMDCAIQLATCAVGCVRAQHALGSGVPRRSKPAQVCVRCMRTRTTCTHHPCLILHQSG